MLQTAQLYLSLQHQLLLHLIPWTYAQVINTVVDIHSLLCNLLTLMKEIWNRNEQWWMSLLSWNEAGLAISASSTGPILRHTLQLIDNLSQDFHTSALIPPLVPRSLISLGGGIMVVGIRGHVSWWMLTLTAPVQKEGRRAIFTGCLSEWSPSRPAIWQADESKDRVCVTHCSANTINWTSDHLSSALQIKVTPNSWHYCNIPSFLTPEYIFSRDPVANNSGIYETSPFPVGKPQPKPIYLFPLKPSAIPNSRFSFSFFQEPIKTPFSANVLHFWLTQKPGLVASYNLMGKWMFSPRAVTKEFKPTMPKTGPTIPNHFMQKMKT